MTKKILTPWTNESWNPITGCTQISPGCMNCYAKSFTKRLKEKGVPAYQAGFGKVICHAELLEKPRKLRSPKIIFTCSMADIFHQDVAEAFIQRIFAVMNECERHTFQIITKRSERMAEMAPRLKWTPNIWVGVTCENIHFKSRIDDLRKVPAEVRFVNAEPLVGDLEELNLEGINLMMAGGESCSYGARQMKKAWVDSIYLQCRKSGIQFAFMKWGLNGEFSDGTWEGGDLYEEPPVEEELCEIPKGIRERSR
jgi:protein gp37